MTEYQQADSRARRTAIIVVVVAAMIGLPAILWLQRSEPQLQTWLEANIHVVVAQPLWGLLAGLVLVMPVIALVWYLLVMAARTIQAERFPPPGYAVSRRTRVLEGAEAVRRGRLVQLMCGLLLAAAAGIPFVLWRVFAMLAGRTTS